MIVTQPKELIAKFVADRVDCPNYWGEYTALAKIDNTGIIVGVLYNNFTSDKSGIVDCQMHVASRPGSKWATREFLYHAFNYPFNQIGCKRITGIVKESSPKIIQFDEKLGFVREGIVRQAMDGENLILMGMLKSECRWLDYKITK